MTPLSNAIISAMKKDHWMIKLVTITCFFVLLQFAVRALAADNNSFTEYILGVKIEVKDRTGLPVQEAEISMKYSKSSSFDTKKTKKDGAAYFPLYSSTSEVKTAPLYELMVKKPGYSSFIYRSDKPSTRIKPLQLKEDLGWKIILKKVKIARPSKTVQS